MYETPITDLAKDEAQEGTQLRALQWEELVAKLAAMRDLRHSLTRQQDQLNGAFSSFADIREELSHESDSQYLENRTDALALQNLNETDRCINPKTLVDRKGPASNNDGMQIVTPCDREIK